MMYVCMYVWVYWWGENLHGFIILSSGLLEITDTNITCSILSFNIFIVNILGTERISSSVWDF